MCAFQGDLYLTHCHIVKPYGGTNMGQINGSDNGLLSGGTKLLAGPVFI